MSLLRSGTGREVTWSPGKPAVMGILNATPDSFYAPSRVGAVPAGPWPEGADLFDLGAESTRPGSAYIDAETELRRLLPVLQALRASDPVTPVSIDTRKQAVAAAAFAAGADWINDISALEDDPDLAPWCAETGVVVVLMHKRGEPQTMQSLTEYADVVEDVRSYLARRAEAAQKAGVLPERIVLDPGLGFGKTPAHNVSLLKAVERFAALGYPVLIGASRKSFLHSLSPSPAERRLGGSLAAALEAAARGAAVLRVHDPFETRQALAVAQALREVR